MIVVHPNDDTTRFLKPIYKDISYVDLYTEKDSNSDIRRALNHKVYPGEYIMMLGHGCEYGLYAPVSANNPFGRLIINGAHVEFLRRHTCVAVWCHANLFAEKYNLHGLFSGMIISEMTEADWCNIPTTPEELVAENNRLAEILRQAFTDCQKLEDIPAYIAEHAPMDTPLQRFNYHSFYYYP